VEINLLKSKYKISITQVVRKNIARHLTILSEKARKRIGGDLHQGSAKRAQELRVKLTRAFRRRLTSHQKNAKLVKTQKKISNFPLRRFGLKA
jgi:large subunit ribosomal protein L35e